MHTHVFDEIPIAPIQDKMNTSVDNWIVNFLDGHLNCTKFAGKVSELASILAGVGLHHPEDGSETGGIHPRCVGRRICEHAALKTKCSN
jgi:beta-galactosidase GanA